MANLFSASFNANQPASVTELIRKYSNFNPESLIAYYEAMIMRPDRRAVLKELKKPILFIVGEEDKAVPLQDSLEQTHIPDLAFIHLLKNTAHMGMIENPGLTNNWLAGFIEASYHPSF
jgi:pimeloyl-ACP methyl ester carboxylesterase